VLGVGVRDYDLRMSADERQAPAVDPVIEAYKKDVDRTLIREQLRRSPDERVQRMIGALRLAEALRRAGRGRAS
jgi:hypothetical protein